MPMEVSTGARPGSPTPTPRCPGAARSGSARTARGRGARAASRDTYWWRRAVEAVAPDAVLARRPSRRSRRWRRPPAGRWKNAVSNTATCGSVGKQLPGGLDAGEVGRVVQRRQRREPSIARCTSVVDQPAPANPAPPCTTRWPTATTPDVARSGPTSANSVEHGRSAARCGRRSGRVAACSSPRRCASIAPDGLADPLDQPGRRALAGDRVDQLVLDRRRAGVEDEHGRVHATLPHPRAAALGSACAWIAVMATVLTMSVPARPVTGR